MIHPRTGLKALAEIREKKFPLRLSIREDATHSTRVLVDQTLAAYGISLKDIESWGGSSPAQWRTWRPSAHESDLRRHGRRGF